MGRNNGTRNDGQPLRHAGPSPLDEEGRPMVRARNAGSKGSGAKQLIVPAAMLRALPDEYMEGRWFSVEFTEDGILYRPHEEQTGTNQIPTPATPEWAKV